MTYSSCSHCCPVEPLTWFAECFAYRGRKSWCHDIMPGPTSFPHFCNSKQPLIQHFHHRFFWTNEVCTLSIFSKVKRFLLALKKHLPWNCLSMAVCVVHKLDSNWNLSSEEIFRKFLFYSVLSKNLYSLGLLTVLLSLLTYLRKPQSFDLSMDWTLDELRCLAYKGLSCLQKLNTCIWFVESQHSSFI